MSAVGDPSRLACPLPAGSDGRVQLGHGSGGKLSAELLRDHLLPHFDDPVLAELGDAAVISVEAGELAFSTDTFVVRPLVFPGGDIGLLAAHGTMNDLAMMGARPRWMSAGLVIEEGLPLELLDRIITSLAGAVRAAGASVVTGDTKVVERGKADGLFINTAGLGIRQRGFEPAPWRVQPGDVILVSGQIGRHGMAIMAARNELGLETEITSDTAPLWPLVEALREAAGPGVHALRDPTRGGLASALNEIAAAAGVGVRIDERQLPVPSDVAAACEMLGLDPLYVANEGVLVAFVAREYASAALAALRRHSAGAAAVGQAVSDHAGMVVLRTGLGATRIVDLLPGDQLPRIC